MDSLYVVAVEDQDDLRSLWRVKFDFFGIPGMILDPEEAISLEADKWKETDLLITDWSMGEISGKEVIERALECNPTIRCHVLTAMPNPVGLPTGVKVWLKPIPVEIIIQEALRGR